MRSARWSVAMLALWAAPALGQKILLELRPRAGDTLRMRLDQVTELSGTRGAASAMNVTTTLRMFSRAIVEGGDESAMHILAITDSVEMSTSDEHARALAQRTEDQLEGRQMRLRLLPNGTVTLAGAPEDVPREVNQLLSVMPASFPATAVAVGDTWIREMPIPPAARFGGTVGGIVRSRFRLDSISPGGQFAYVSMEGTLRPADPAAPALEREALGGTVEGSIIINRRRGWLSESRFAIEMRAAVLPQRAGAAAAAMEFRMRVTQKMRVTDKRR